MKTLFAQVKFLHQILLQRKMWYEVQTENFNGSISVNWYMDNEKIDTTIILR